MQLRSLMMVAALSCSAVPCLAQDDGPRVRELTPPARAAIEKGLGRLSELQVRQTGNFGKSFKVASTSLAGLAFLASGDTYRCGRYAGAIEGAVKYLLSDTVRKRVPAKPGYCTFGDGEGMGKMHANGFAVLFLAEVYGGTPRDLEIREALRGAIAAILDAQTDLGGWGYHFRHDPEWGEDEASVTITQIQALRAARNAGIYVPAASVARAIGYVKKSMTSDGSCRYSLTMGSLAERSRTSYELSAAAVATLNATGVYLGGGDASDELSRGLGYIRKTVRALDRPFRAAQDFHFYGNLYAAQAMFQAGGEDWDYWFPKVRQELLERQRLEPPAGGWESERNFGEAYATASALLILQIPKRYLPIFQK